MIPVAKTALRVLPWLLLLAVLIWLFISKKSGIRWIEGGKEAYHSTILTRTEQMGRLELVQFNFQEVTELKKISDYVDLKIFKYKPLPDAKAVLISQGSATGCIDLTKLTESDLRTTGDTLHVVLPSPELCYFKVDLDKSRIYDLQISYMSEEEQSSFVQELYQIAEKEIKNGALEAGILEQTKEGAHAILRPLLESISGKVVLITFAPESLTPLHKGVKSDFGAK